MQESPIQREPTAGDNAHQGKTGVYAQRALMVLLVTAMVGVAVALWRGAIPIEWFASLGYRGIFVLSFVNAIAPVSGPSQVVTFLAAKTLNPLGVGLAAGVGGAIGELATYAFGHSLRAAQIESVERAANRIARWPFLRVSQTRSFIPLAILASFPNPLFKPASALAGTVQIGAVRYFVPVIVGKAIRHIAIAYAGYYTLSQH